MLEKVISEIVSKGGKIFYVGGFVRDRLIGKSNKDVDVEVYGITPRQLKETLSQFGTVDEVGASFGVLKIHGVDIDFTMPRRENKVSGGHKGFDISVDPFMSTKEAAMRRDFTMNALLQDVVTGQIIDHFGGLEDIKNKVIRHVNDKSFVEDSLRVFRACQFAARFEFRIAEETIRLCQEIDTRDLPRERVFEEVKKGLLKSSKPSIMFEYLRETRVLNTWFPELAKLIGCQQDPRHHPEGDVWQHTMLVIDEAAKHRSRFDNETDALIYMLGALFHDVGKPITTIVTDDGVTSYKHAEVGAELVVNALNRITTNKEVINGVVELVKYHMRPHQLNSDKSIRRFLSEVKRPEMIVYLAIADHLGRKGNRNIDHYGKLLLKIDEFQHLVEPIVKGRDLIAIGMQPGTHFKVILERLYQIQIEEGITSKEELLSRI